MLASRKAIPATSRRSNVVWRRGLTLLEVIVTIAILGILAVPITLNFASSSRGGGESARLDEAALRLSKMADAASRYSGIQTSNASFYQVMLANPGRLSQLTTKPTASSTNACGGLFSSLTLWKGPYYNWPIPTTGTKITDGFFADDTLSRYDSVGVVTKVPATGGNTNQTSWGTVAIVMQSVSRSDALGLRSRIEGTSTATTGTVRFADTGDPVTLYYHFGTHGC